ncbi:hypothetical protein PG985_005864 [Apiospora marii]|uniref:uncharacterized protein n=1 Tax=Apiospora marii TaxID=335849 RepID=UPI00313292C0
MAATFSDLPSIAAAANAIDRIDESETVRNVIWMFALSKMMHTIRHPSTDDLTLILKMCLRLAPSGRGEANVHAGYDKKDVADLVYCYSCTFKIAFQMPNEIDVTDFIAHLIMSAERIGGIATAAALHTCRNVCAKSTAHLPYQKVAIWMAQGDKGYGIYELKAAASSAHQSLCQCLREDVAQDLRQQLEESFNALQNASMGEDWQYPLLLHMAVCDVFRVEIEQRGGGQDQFADWWNKSPFPSLLLTTSRTLLLFSGMLRDQAGDIIYAFRHLLDRLSLFEQIRRCLE